MTHAFEACTICYFVVKSRKSTISHSRVSFNGWMAVTSDPELSKKRKKREEKPADAAEWIMDEVPAVSPPVLPGFSSHSFLYWLSSNWCIWPQINSLPHPPPPSYCRCLALGSRVGTWWLCRKAYQSVAHKRGVTHLHPLLAPYTPNFSDVTGALWPLHYDPLDSLMTPFSPAEHSLLQSF